MCVCVLNVCVCVVWVIQYTSSNMQTAYIYRCVCSSVHVSAWSHKHNNQFVLCHSIQESLMEDSLSKMTAVWCTTQ